ncbi:MAG: aminoacyl-tRNA hydrolase [Deltaproteobacteria bacterium]|jgi:PTH1 family peptidyl-tRNA hydrolase|nr:aminoacyl-tRNA hydrolase [Deltaproteobacteria bacterium]
MEANTETILILGLGNPGPINAETRHNAGFMALTLLNARYRLGNSTSILSSAVVEGEISGRKIVLAWPLNYMENSGKALGELLNHLNIASKENVLVVHDDATLPLGVIKTGDGTAPAGHDGLKSVLAELRGPFPALRLGIGGEAAPPPEDPAALRDFLLQPFEFEDLDVIRPALALAAEGIHARLTGGMEALSAFLEGRAPGL